MPTVTILKGLPASGKSTWAKEQVKKSQGKVKRVNKDDLRAMIDAGEWSRENEEFILDARNALILEALDQEFDVIVDDTNLSPKHESAIRDLVQKFIKMKWKEADIEVKFFNTPLEECLERDSKRGEASVGKKVIMDMYRKYLHEEPVKPAYVEGLPDAIIVDLDGTVALHTSGRSPYDADRCLEDSVNEPIAEIVRKYYDQGTEIIICSGREDEHEKNSALWLSRNKIPYTAIYMRKTGDKRNDAIVKKEIYETEIKGKWNIKFVLDDRDRVVDAWRSLGLTCLQVAPGNF